MLIATPDQCECHDGDPWETQRGVRLMHHSTASIFRMEHMEVWYCGVHSLCFHHHTIAATCTPIRKNKSTEMQQDINEESHKRLA